jgi:hypothetical protein
VRRVAAPPAEAIRSPYIRFTFDRTGLMRSSELTLNCGLSRRVDVAVEID